MHSIHMGRPITRFMRRVACVTGLAAVSCAPMLGVSSPAYGQETEQRVSAADGQPANVDVPTALALIRSAVIALDQANKTANYTVLRAMGSPDFQFSNSAVDLAGIFAGLRSKSLDLSFATVMDPQLTLQPQIERSGLLHLGGFYPAGTDEILFDLMFQNVDKRWRLSSIAVNSVPATNAATQPMAVNVPPVHAVLANPVQVYPALVPPVTAGFVPPAPLPIASALAAPTPAPADPPAIAPVKPVAPVAVPATPVRGRIPLPPARQKIPVKPAAPLEP